MTLHNIIRRVAWRAQTSTEAQITAKARPPNFNAKLEHPTTPPADDASDSDATIQNDDAMNIDEEASIIAKAGSQQDHYER